MSEALGLCPVVELILGSFNFGGDEADGGLQPVLTGQFGAEEVAGFSATKVLEEGEALVDEATHPIDGGSFGFHCHNPILSEKVRSPGVQDSGITTGGAGGSRFVEFEWDYTRI